jgi:hypothetical protein
LARLASWPSGPAAAYGLDWAGLDWAGLDWSGVDDMPPLVVYSTGSSASWFHIVRSSLVAASWHLVVQPAKEMRGLWRITCKIQLLESWRSTFDQSFIISFIHLMSFEPTNTLDNKPCTPCYYYATAIWVVVLFYTHNLFRKNSCTSVNQKGECQGHLPNPDTFFGGGQANS